MKRFLLLTLTGLLLFSACTTVLTLDQNTIEIPSAGLSTDIHLNVNKDWTATSSADWCRISPSSGDKNTTVIHVTVSKSSLYDNRECTITVTCDKKTETVSVVQLQEDVIKVGTNMVVIGDGDSSGMNFSTTINETDHEFGFGVSSNVEYDIVPNCDWIQYRRSEQSTKGLSHYTVVFHADENKSIDERVGIISFRQKGGIVESRATITQEAKDFISASTKTVAFEWNNASSAISVTANVDFEIVIPDGCTWLSAEKKGSAKEYSVEISAEDFIPTPEYFGPNPVADRTAVITLAYGDLKEEITVTQKFKDCIWLSKTEINAYVGYGCVLQFQPFFHSGINSTLSMSIDRPDIAQVYSQGIINPKAAGYATLTVSNADNTYSAQCALTVKNIKDDIYVAAGGKSMNVSGGYTTLVFHSNIHYPEALQSIKFNSVWLCYPDGTAFDIKSTSNGYVEFKPIVVSGTFSSSQQAYYATWFVVYQVEIDGEACEYRAYLNPYTWSGTI